MPYSITTKDGITINNIPDDVAPDSPELKERVAQIRLTGGQAQPTAPAMPPDTLGRQVGLATRPMAQTVLTAGGMLPMVVDPMVNLFNLAAGTNIPTQTQAVEKTLSAVGFPQPRTGQERVIQDVATAGYGVGGVTRAAAEVAPRLPGMARELAQFFAQSPKAQTAAALTASGAGGMLREGGAPPALQVGGAMLAGMVAPGGPTLSTTQRALAAPSGLVKPFTQAGREVIVGNVLNKLATDPQRAMQNLQQAQPLVPGVRVTTAAGARDPGLAAAETAIRGLDQSGAFPSVLSANQQALLESFRKLGGRSGDVTTPGSIPYAEAKRAGITGPLRESVFANKQPVSVLPIADAISGIMANPATQRKTVDEAMGYVNNLLAKRIDPETGTIDPMALYSVRKDITDAMAGKLSGEQANLRLAKGQLAELLPIIDNVIESGAPGFKNYMQKFEKSSSAIDQMKIMQGIEAQVTTGQPNLMTGEPVLAAGALRRQLATKAEEIGAQLSPAAQTRLDNIINEINRGQAATAPGVKAPGSNTFQNMSMGNLIGRVFSESMADNTTLRTMTRPLDFLYKLPDQQIQQLLVEAMLDPKLAAMMMGKANIMKVEPMAQSLRKKAEQLGFGAAIGAQE
tara:strand:+ start:1851 stop:3731 length:1881 start_codon:yes stop_codon:yes gene_type:complete